MKIFLLTFFFLLGNDTFSQYLPDSVASKLKIIRVVRNMKDPNSRTLFTDYYDKTGKVVKSESLDRYSNERTTTTYKYENGLITNETFKSYYKNKLVSSQTAAFKYDTNKKIISTVLYLDDKRIFKDTTISSKYSDTTYSYSNDTMMYDPKRKLTLVGSANTFHSEKTTIDHYSEIGSKIKQITYSHRARERCKNINRFSMTDSTGYSITDFFKAGDTTIEKVTRWLCVTGKETRINKTVKILGNEIYKEQWSDTTKIYDKLNDLNLITSRRIINKIGTNIKAETTITYSYYFDKRR